MAQLPRPYSRPSINLSVPDEKREWKLVAVSSLTPNDIVVNYGMVTGASSDAGVTVVEWRNGKTSIFESGDSVHAFVRV